jgi:predicted permease
MRDFWDWLTSRFRRRQAFDADMRAEFAFHLDERTEVLIRAGMPPEAARRQAQVEFGSQAAHADRGREVRGFGVWDDFRRDLVVGSRVLGRQWGTTVVIVLTLAMGIGANTALFSLIDALFLRELPVNAPSLLALYSGEDWSGSMSGSRFPDGAWKVFSNDAYVSLSTQPASLGSVAAYAASEDRVAARVTSQAGSPVRASASLVSGNYFDVVGATPLVGRELRPSDDRLEAPPVVVISHNCWQNLFHGSREAIGSQVTINKTTFAVVGVMPPEFFGVRVRRAPDFWVPLAWQPEIQVEPPARLRPNYYWLSLFSRLAPGQSIRAAQQAATVALHQYLVSTIGSAPDAATLHRVQSTFVAMTSGARGVSRDRDRDFRPLALLFVTVGLLLLIACANVATLLLCRANVRRTEVAVRRALGAGRGRLIRQWLTESLMLAAMGGVGGLFLAHWIAPVLASFFPSGPFAVALNGTVLAFATLLALGASVLFGLAPALYAGRVDELAALRSTGHGTDRRRRTLGVSEPLVIGQIAVSLVLVVGATLFARTLFNLEHEPLGFDQDNVLLTQINPRQAGYTPADVGVLYRRLYDQLAALPGVQSVTFARYSPFSGHTSSFGASVDGYTPPTNRPLQLEAVEVGPNYPQTIGIPLVSGRAIGIEDTMGATPVAMVNEAFVHQFFPTSNPLGHHLTLSGSYEIVGVVRDALFHTPRDQMIPFVFVSMLQVTDSMALDCEFELRTRGNAATLAPLVRQAVATTDGRVTVSSAQTLRTQVLNTFQSERVMSGFVTVLAALALIVAGVGLYGVVSHGVARRTKEIGLRLSLGATPGDVVSLIVRETGARVAIGLVVGSGLAAMASQAVASQLFGIGATDVVSFAVAATLLALVALCASVLPTLRALRIHPSVALRTE